MTDYPRPPFPAQQQEPPGSFLKMDPQPDHGEESWQGAGRLEGKVAIITGGDSGIGRAVAIAFAREGADIALVFLDESRDADDTAAIVRAAGRTCLKIRGDVSNADFCRAIVDETVRRFGRLDILVNNAGHQAQIDDIADITEAEWRYTFAVNIDAIFFLTQAALAHMLPGSAIINTASINADKPNPDLLAYATTKGAVQNFTAGLAQMLASRGIRVNAVAPGPTWTPLIVSTMTPETVHDFGKSYPIGRPAQPVEMVPAFLLLADPRSSYISGATIPVTGGMPMI